MESISEQFSPTASGGILYDASRLRKPGAEAFEPGHWAALGALDTVPGGRGSIAIVRNGEQRWVLRHYRRGGWMARLSRDRYFWLGAARTRSFAEWRLLAELRRRGLPVPAPVAASYARGLLTYRADLITELVPGTRTLADAITGQALPPAQWHAIGRTIAEFHEAGVQHADLNAHNILLGPERAGPGATPPIHVLDFDRGRIRARGSWESAVLDRLRRSLEKIRRQRTDVRFTDADWQALLAGYASPRP
jgi:3-deoxy-D-manno-octulosonic acid kinase